MSKRTVSMVTVPMLLILLVLLLWTTSLAVSEPGGQTASTAMQQTVDAEVQRRLEATAIEQTVSAQMEQVLQVTQTANAVATMTATAMPPSLRDDRLLHDRSLITGDPCAAPCWRGITPGVTAWDDALVILEDDPTILDAAIQTAGDSAAVAASFAEPSGLDASGQLFSDDGETVGLTFLRLAPDITLGEVREVYGEPTYAVGTPFSDNPPQAIVNLVYPDDQMIVYIFAQGRTGKLDNGSEVVGTLYMKSADMDTLLETSSLHEWVGLASFETYGPDGPFEVTPISTPGA